MDITGKFVKTLPEVTGQGKNGTWVKQDFIIKTAEQFPKKVCITAWGDLIDSLHGIKAGDTVNVAINVESREYNSKWYTDVKAWKITGEASSSQPDLGFVPKGDGTAYEVKPNEMDDDLPF